RRQDRPRDRRARRRRGEAQDGDRRPRDPAARAEAVRRRAPARRLAPPERSRRRLPRHPARDDPQARLRRLVDRASAGRRAGGVVVGQASRVNVPAPAPATRVARVDAIDLVRGVLMIAITWVHAVLAIEPGHDRLVQAARYLLSGTVGFTTVSGLLVGWFAVIKRDRYERVVRRYQVQAARLLLIAHPLMALALFLPNADPFTDYALRTLFITDTLAVLFVAVVPFVPRVAPDLRLAAGVAVLVGGALLDLYSPSSDVGRVI